MMTIDNRDITHDTEVLRTGFLNKSEKSSAEGMWDLPFGGKYE